MNMENPGVESRTSRLSDEAMRRIYQNWMRRYGILYVDNEEDERRFRIFQKAFEAIEEYNTTYESCLLSLSPYSDLTYEEFFNLYADRRWRDLPKDMVGDIILRGMLILFIDHHIRRGPNHPEEERIIHFTQDDSNPLIW